MDELLENIAAQKELINNTLKILEKTLRRKRRTFLELAAISTCLHNAYNGMENLLKQVLKYLGVPIPETSTSHKDLISLAVEQNVISVKLSKQLDDYRAFRHFFVHGYGVLLQEGPLKPLAEELPEIWDTFEKELDQFTASLK